MHRRWRQNAACRKQALQAFSSTTSTNDYQVVPCLVRKRCDRSWCEQRRWWWQHSDSWLGCSNFSCWCSRISHFCTFRNCSSAEIVPQCKLRPAVASGQIGKVADQGPGFRMHLVSANMELMCRHGSSQPPRGCKLTFAAAEACAS